MSKVWQAINIDLCLPALTVGSVVSTYCIMADNKASHTMSAAAYLTVHSNRIPSLQFGLHLFSFSVLSTRMSKCWDVHNTMCYILLLHRWSGFTLFRCRELLYSRLSKIFNLPPTHLPSNLRILLKRCLGATEKWNFIFPHVHRRFFVQHSVLDLHHYTSLAFN